MSQARFCVNCGYYENLNKIIPNDSKTRNFDVEEVEIFKIF